MRITLCGSARFMPLFDHYNSVLSTLGHTVYTLATRHKLDENAEDTLKRILDAVHKQKIANSDVVFILNKDGYYGDSTKSEIEYALSQKRLVLYMEPTDATARLSITIAMEQLNEQRHPTPPSPKPVHDGVEPEGSFGTTDGQEAPDGRVPNKSGKPRPESKRANGRGVRSKSSSRSRSTRPKGS